MKVTNINNIKISKNIFRTVGVGTTAACYLQSDGRVYKAYRNTHNKERLFKYRGDMLDFLYELYKMKNDTYIGPEEVIVDDESNVLGYMMDYKKADTLKKIKTNTKLSDIEKCIPKIKEDTAVISEKGYRIYDMHLRNMLYNDDFYVIDIDGGHIKTGNLYSNQFRYEHNLKDIYNIIIDAIFGIEYDCKIRFDDYKLQEIYSKIAYSEENIDFIELLNSLKELIKKENPTIKEMRSVKSRILTVEKIEKYTAY